MTLEQLAGLGEIIAALGVVISLIYVARQIRQNTDAVQANTEQWWAQAGWSRLGPVSTDRELAEWWLAGAEQFESLDEIDKQRHILFEFSVLQVWWNAYLARKKGLLSDEVWDHHLSVMKTFGQRQAIRVAWKANKHLWSEEYRELVSRYLE